MTMVCPENSIKIIGNVGKEVVRKRKVGWWILGKKRIKTSKSVSSQDR